MAKNWKNGKKMAEQEKNYNNKQEIITLLNKNKQIQKTNLNFLDQLQICYYLCKLNKNIYIFFSMKNIYKIYYIHNTNIKKK